jgi:heavy metal efflux system protein
VDHLLDNFIALALGKRVVVLVLALLTAVAGIVAWRFLPLEAYPELLDPLVRVITLYPGKGTEEVERTVTIPLEKELN